MYVQARFIHAPGTDLYMQFFDAVYESGCTFWDSEDMYGDSEDLLGQWYAQC